MRAVLLAGGAGTRLRPLSAETPKPMVKMFDKPVMEYSVELLRAHHFRDITVTLQTMPQKVMDYFGDGSSFGVRLSYSVEAKPLGTAGGVRAALQEKPPREPFLILSGDAVCDFDLGAALRFHTDNEADATLLLSRQKKLLDYGLVMTNAEGRVTRFIEKPGWGQVFTDTVNTGIYILSPAALAEIPPDGAFDFARDLFPQMLSKGMRVFGYPGEGYWCDIGDSEAFLRCCRDVLDGRVALRLPPSKNPPPDCAYSPPCYIAPNARIGSYTRIGPYAAIGEGSRLGDHSSAESCVLDGAVLEPWACCEGAYLGRGAVLGQGAVARAGSVMGGGSRAGAEAELMEGVWLWPRKEVDAGGRVTAHIGEGRDFRGAVFDGKGRLFGRLNADLTPEFNLRLGIAAGLLAQDGSDNSGEVAVGWQGGHAARLCAAALSLGVDSFGGRTVRSDALYPACAAFAGGAYRIPVNIFVKQDGDALHLFFFDSDGLPLSHDAARKLETAALRGDTALGAALEIRSSGTLSGTQDLYARSAALPPDWAQGGRGAIALRAAGHGGAAEALRRTLVAAGCTHAGPVLRLSDDGLRLSCTLENGTEMDTNRLLGVMILVESALGTREIALPAEAPHHLEQFGTGRDVRILREGRDGVKARSLLAAQPFMRDMLFLAARLAHGLRRLDAALPELERRLPAFYVAEGEIPLEKDRGEVMRALAGAIPDAEMYEGFGGKHKNGWVHVSPLPSRKALRIAAEGRTMEAAKEIFADMTRMTKSLDGK